MAWLTPDQHHTEVLIVPQRPVRIERTLRRLRETCVVRGDEAGRPCVGLLHCADAHEPQLLHDSNQR